MINIWGGEGWGQGGRQDFTKGGADARREMPAPLRSGVSGRPGGLGPLEAHENMFLE